MIRKKKNVDKYEAPEGYLYDWVKLPENGEHLYSKILFLSRRDTIDNYKLVKESEKENI